MKVFDKPIVGMAPMDGVTDAVFRYMLAKHGKPSVIYTEFTSVEGLARGAEKLMIPLIYNEIERPIFGQLFGTEPDSFYKCAVMLCELGFDGIDINMGCPVKTVASRGAGAALIKTPKLAREIIRSVKRGVADWCNGVTMEQVGLHANIIAEIEKRKKDWLGDVGSHKQCEEELGRSFNKLLDVGAGSSSHKQLEVEPERSSHKLPENVPVSVKTRIGHNRDIAEEWIGCLVEERPAAVCVHGRTLKQMYAGKADWDAIGRAAAICKKNNIVFLGNGDIRSVEEAHEKIEQYGLDGVLVGRAVLGNPWFFLDKEPTFEERILAVSEHCSLFEKIFGDRLPFHIIKKHLAWYMKGFEGVKDIRMRLMMSHGFEEVRSIINSISYDTKDCN